jgi:hypothetical protein
VFDSQSTTNDDKRTFRFNETTFVPIVSKRKNTWLDRIFHIFVELFGQIIVELGSSLYPTKHKKTPTMALSG